MRPALLLSLAIATLAAPVGAQTPRTLFRQLEGQWVLTGVIDKQRTTHDVDARMILGGRYVQLHEVSREKTAGGAPAYEAYVTIAMDTTGTFAAVWLDNTGITMFPPDAIMRGKAAGDSIPFTYKYPGGVFHTTFIYSRSDDTWRWTMDDESGGRFTPFARVTLSRKK